MDALYASLKEGNYGIALILLVVLILINIPRLIDFSSFNRKRRMNDLVEALANENVTDEIKTHLKDEIQIECFRIAHGVRISTPMLNAILTISERVDTKVSFRHLLRVAKVMPNIDNLDSGSYRIKLEWVDYFYLGYSLVTGVLMVIIGLFLFIAFMVILPMEVHINYLIFGLFSFVTGAYAFNEGVSLASVYHINKALQSYDESCKASL
ncbi:hypothetical protein [Aliivibrio fischeri]|uniref:hypothetical protein n=1 Tax=Aliivibrio fischeri TaxID=668 RepID=UPI00080DC06D|nr:hypothetical protein [Aliivibrio fischeri]OCH02168.1 hypothetical protein A6E09_18555 [Aliivibrio fischeri]